jgi:peptidoglycan hydrolase-like protein with peptidoglycan-binding domain
MRTVYRRRSRRPAHREVATFKKDNQQEQAFFGDAAHEPFFKPSITVPQAAVQRKCAECEGEEKAQRKAGDKEEEKLQRAPEKKEEEKVQRTPEKKEEEKVQRAPEKKEEEKVQRVPEKEEEEQEKIQKKEAATTTTAAPAHTAANYIGSIHGKGQPMDKHTQSFYESRIGADFSNVKIHTGQEAAQSAKDINAQAYTYGNHIVFNEGKYQPETSAGKHLLAHELTHVVQQGGKKLSMQAAPPVLTQAQLTAATSFNRSHYDERSARVIQIVTGTGVDGRFGPATARAVAAFQAANAIPANGQVDMATLEVMLTNRVAADRREHIVQLVVDFLNLPVTANTLSIHFDASVGFGAFATTDFEPGNMRIIRLGPLAFLTAGILGLIIGRELVTPAPALPALGPRPTLLTPAQENAAIAFVRSRFTDVRSRNIIQGFVGATPDGHIGPDTVERIAEFQRANGLTVDGQIGRATLSQMSTNLIAAGNEDSAIRLIIDFFNIRQDGNLLDVFFDPSVAANAETDFRVGEPVRVRIGTSGINQPFEGLVHTIAHEFEHVRRLKQGIVSRFTHEFLGEAIEILSVGMPQENLEAVAPGAAGFTPGFANDADRAVANWNLMPLADRRRFRSRFIQVRAVVRRRIAASTPAQQALHAPLLASYNAVVLP